MRPGVAIAEELITESEATRRVPGRDSEVRAWLRSLGIARRGPTGGTLYRWSEVVAAVPLLAEPEPARPSRRVTARAEVAPRRVCVG